MNTIFFDLDGTLLPLEENEFVKRYFYLLSKRFIKYGYKQEEFINIIWAGTKAMIKNDGTKSNEEVFWETFTNLTGLRREKVEKEFEDFYLNDFSCIKKACEPNPLAIKIVQILKEKGYELILSTNPVFPLLATIQRILWAGLNPCDFTYITTYENSRYCKPNPNYYYEILKIIGKKPSNCLMIGNSIKEDMITSKIGFDVFLLTNNLINPDNEDINQFPHGDFNKLWEMVLDLPQLK